MDLNIGGRPMVMTGSVLASLKGAFMIGASDREACEYAGICPASLYNYQARTPGFLEQKEAWKSHPILKAKITIYNHLNETKIAKWFLERKAPNEFCTRRISKPDRRVDFNLIEATIERLDNESKMKINPAL